MIPVLKKKRECQIFLKMDQLLFGHVAELFGEQPGT
jgi:hypothetical protein